MKMSFEEFKREIERRRKDYMPKELQFAMVSVEPVSKLNSSYDALVIRTSHNPAGATINLTRLYEDAASMELDDVIGRLKDMVGDMEYDRVMQMLEDNHYLTNYNDVKENLFLRCSNAERNKAVLENCPHREMNGVVLTAHVGLKWEQGTSPRYSAVVTNDMMKGWKISEETLFADAEKSARKRLPITYGRLSDFLMGLPGGDMLPPNTSAPDMFVITNRQGYFGAAAAFYPDVLQQVHERLGNFYMLPSSVHEWLILPEEMGMQVSDLERMVRDVNYYEVSDEDFLSDDVYHFDGEKLELARNYEKNIQKENAAEYMFKESVDEPEITAGARLMM